MMVHVDIVPAAAGQVQGVVQGRVRATGASAAVVLLDISKLYSASVTIFAPKAMANCMKAGDMRSRGDINAAAAPAYASNHR